MNLTVEPTELPPPSTDEVAQHKAEQPQGSKHPSLKMIGIAAAVLIGFGIVATLNDDDESTTRSTPVAVDSAGAGTGDAAVDLQIVDAVWTQQKGILCPALDDVRATMPSLSDEEIIDMGMSLADLSSITSPQRELLKQHMLDDC